MSENDKTRQLMGFLLEQQPHLTASFSQRVEQVKETDKQMAETDERLNAFINFVERYLNNGRGGEKGGDDR